MEIWCEAVKMSTLSMLEPATVKPPFKDHVGDKIFTL